MEKFKYEIYDIDGYLTESYETYNSYEEAEKECLKEIDSIIERAKREFENPLITGYSIQKVEEKENE